MKRNLQLQMLLAVLSAGLMFSSCGNIDIVKRRYRPGFHVDISKKQKKSHEVEEPEVADARHAEKVEPMESKQPTLASEKPSEELTASTENTPSDNFSAVAEKKESMKKQLHSPEFKEMSFKDRMRTIEHEMKKPSPVASTEWMKWVSFGTGIGSLAFGAMALLFAFLTAVFFTGFVWGAAVLAILLGGAAITFSILYKKNSGSSSQSKMGMLFGIIGAGLGVLAIIVGAIFFAIFVLN
ncbi:MAG: hypothetical protein GC178_07115 [Flavobacteriales bacterium]|nr:hypothetical protein [Flavobacteriales bacterium]